MSLININPLENLIVPNSENTQFELDASDVFYKDTAGWASGVFVEGDYAYVADETSLSVINISDPTNSGNPNTVATTGNAYDVFVAGDYAYVAVGASGLDVINITDPTNPTFVTNEDTANALDVVVSGDYAYLADGTSGLAVINITDPTNPVLLSSESTTMAIGIFVEGNYAYLADATSGLAVINISNPMDPGTPVHADTDGNANDVFVSGDCAYVADGGSGLAVINISDPMNPILLANETTNNAWGVFVSGDYAYVADMSNGLAVINVSDPTNPNTPANQSTVNDAYDVFVSGNYAYMAVWSDGLAIIKIGEMIDPELPEYKDTSNAYNVVVEGDYAYVADRGGGLAVINISDPKNPGDPDTIATTGDAYDVFVAGDYAYVATASGLDVINITDPTNPSLLANKAATGTDFGVFVSGDFAYLAGTGLDIVNISDPVNPGNPVNKALTASANDVFVAGDYAYIADGASGLAVINISDPTTPGDPEYALTLDRAFDVFVSGDYAYVADESGGLVVIDISDPTNPVFSANESTTDLAYGVFVSGDYAYVADRTDGLAIIDISNPTNPGTPVHEDTIAATGVVVAGDYAYLADGLTGLAAIKIMLPWYALVAPTLSPISPSPDYDGVINLDWNDVTGAMEYYVYRNTSLITTMTGQTPNTTVFTSDYQDTLSVDDTYYYVIVAGNGRGVSWISNCESVIVTIDTLAPWSNTPGDQLNLEANSTGNTIDWVLGDLMAPGNYSVLINGSSYIDWTASWINNTNLAVPIDTNRGLGGFTYQILYNDTAGNNGPSDSVWVTIVDTTTPWDSDPPDQPNVEANSTSNTVDWQLWDMVSGGDYDVYRNSTEIIASTPWTNGTLVQAPIDTNIGLGVWQYQITYDDGSSNGAIDTVYVTIVDTTDPWDNDPADQPNVEANTTGNTITWQLWDGVAGGTYTVSINGSSYMGPTAWTNGSSIAIPIDASRNLGVWEYIITYQDSQGNTVPDTVYVTLVDTTLPLSSAPADATYYRNSAQTIDWMLTDTVAPGFYRVWRNGSVEVDWTAWTNNTNLAIPVNTTINGLWNYTIEYNDSAGNLGVVDEVLITIRDTPVVPPPPPIPGFELFFILIGLLAVAFFILRKRSILKDD